MSIRLKFNLIFLMVVVTMLFAISDATILKARESIGIVPIKEDFQVNENMNSSDQRSPAIAVDDNGSFVIVWLEECIGEVNAKIYGQRYTSNGTAQGNNFRISDETADIWPYTSPAIAMDGSGKFIVVWADGRDSYSGDEIYGQRYNSEGTALGGNFKITDDAEDTIYPSSSPAIAADYNGNYIVVWQDARNGNDWDIYGQRYNSSGAAQGRNFKISDDTENFDQHNPAIAVDGRCNFGIVWTDGRNGGDLDDIYCQYFKSDGTAQNGNFKINDEEAVIDYTSFSLPKIASDGSGNFMVVWRDFRDENWPLGDIYGQYYNSSGEPQSNNFMINDDPGNIIQLEPAIAMNENGNFIVVWADERNERSTKTNIYGQVFDINIHASGANYRVNKSTGLSNRSPDVKFVNNYIYYAWRDNRVSGQGSDIFARIDMFGYSSIEEDQKHQTSEYFLHPNYPNPFNPTTTIRYSIIGKDMIKLQIFDISGRLVKTLVNTEQQPGVFSVEWNARDDAGNAVTSGIYLYRLTAGNKVLNRKMILTK